MRRPPLIQLHKLIKCTSVPHPACLNQSFNVTCPIFVMATHKYVLSLIDAQIRRTLVDFCEKPPPGEIKHEEFIANAVDLQRESFNNRLA